MTFRLGNVTFSDWVSLPYEGGHTDTFIFDIDAANGLPPFGYRPLLQRLVGELKRKRPGASLWLRVNAPGEWYLMEIKCALRRGLSIQYALTPAGEAPQFRSFSYPPRLFHAAPPPPPKVDDGLSHVPQEELKCLQVLVRIWKGNEEEIASLTGLSTRTVYDHLEALQERGLAVLMIGTRIQNDKNGPPQPDPFPLWHPTRKGTSLALRSWGASRGVDFSRAREQNPDRICTLHRSISRRWLAWLRAAYPRAGIWSGWSESRLPGVSVYPDALAWGRVQGFETLFWLEVGDAHKSAQEIVEITRIRLASALKFCRETSVRLVYAQISPIWVQGLVGMALGPLPPVAAVVMASPRRYGMLPNVEWGRITS